MDVHPSFSPNLIVGKIGGRLKRDFLKWKTVSRKEEREG